MGRYFGFFLDVPDLIYNSLQLILSKCEAQRRNIHVLRWDDREFRIWVHTIYTHSSARLFMETFKCSDV